MALQYTTAYMHLAFRKTTPIHIHEMYHWLIKDESYGPTIKTTILSVETFPLQERTPMLPAYQRLKNYDIDDVKDLSKFEGMFSQSYVPDNLSIWNLEEEVVDACKVVRAKTYSVTEDKFSNSICDADLPQ